MLRGAREDLQGETKAAWLVQFCLFVSTLILALGFHCPACPPHGWGQAREQGVPCAHLTPTHLLSCLFLATSHPPSSSSSKEEAKGVEW